MYREFKKQNIVQSNSAEEAIYQPPYRKLSSKRGSLKKDPKVESSDQNFESDLLLIMYKLTYFGIRGRAEVIRMTLELTGQQYTDVRISGDQWQELQKNIKTGQLPILETPEKKILSESMAIARYLCRKFEMMGDSDWEYYLIERAIGQAAEILAAITGMYFQTPAENRSTAASGLVNGKLEKNLTNLVNFLAESGTGFITGRKVTLADLCVMCVTDCFVECSAFHGLLDPYPELIEHHRLCCSSEPKLNDYVLNRPKTDM